MRFGTLSTKELINWAQGDARYESDPLFTELVERLTGARVGDQAKADNKPLKVDVDVR